MVKKFKVVHIREDCIGCGACASVCPEYWDMDSEGKSKLKGGVKSDGGETLGPIEENFDCNNEAAESCPVNCIHIFEIDSSNNENKLI